MLLARNSVCTVCCGHLVRSGPPLAEIERLTLLAKQQGQEIAITREGDEAKDREIERLRALVRSAYEEGLMEGQTLYGTPQSWERSEARRALTGERVGDVESKT